MSLIDIVRQRRSIRKYASKDVDESLVREVIDCARLAPSGNNAQPSRYLIARSQEISEMKDAQIIRDKWAYDAPVIIVCCADPDSYPRFVEGWDSPNEARALRDLSIASSYLVLRAAELGLGTCYCGWIRKEEIKDVLSIPKSYIVPYIITLGYPDESPGARPRKEIEEVLL